MKILIADDEEVSRIMLQTVLEEWGYSVISTGDGNEAWATMQEKDAPQLAVLDWMMPGRDGPALCRELRSQERKDPLYLILLTAKAEGVDIVQGFDAGADDYIVKPYDVKELQARINAGRRMIALQDEQMEREKLQGVLEMAGAVCHELNQPLQSVSGFSELLLMDAVASDPNYECLKSIKMGIERIGKLTRRIMEITRYRSKPYPGGISIIDIEGASRFGEGEE